ncbi:MAG: hypothetical protein ACAH12_01120 [Methylophilaceae bacterium]
MINSHKINVSTYQGTPPASKDRTLSGPIYTNDEILELAKSGKAEFWQKKSREDAQDYKLDVAKLCALITSAINSGLYHQSEWCMQSKEKTAKKTSNKEIWIAADSYTVKVTEIDGNGKAFEVEWFLKFGKGKGGSLLSVSNHHPKDK